MTKTLLLMRHGKAAWPEGVRDKDRPLAERGIKAVPVMAAHAMRSYPRPDLVLISDAERTQRTFDLLHAVYGPLKHEFEPRLYDAWALKMLGVIREQREPKTLLLLAHNPGLQELGENLANETTSDPDALLRLGMHMPTSGLIVLQSDDEWRHWRNGSASLRHFVTPRMLGGVDED